MPDFFNLPLLIFLGLIFGSFSTSIIYDFVNNEDSIGKMWLRRSHCPRCFQVLSVWCLIPVLSYIFLMGKCHSCRAKISIKYPLIELASLGLFLLAYYQAAGNLLIFGILSFCYWNLLVIAVIDLETCYIYDIFIIFLLCGGLIYNYISNKPLVERIIIALITSFLIFLVGFITSKVLKKEALGFGDVKLFCVLFNFLPFSAFSYFLTCCGILGIVFGIISRLSKGVKYFPFGPSIICGFLIVFHYFA